MFLCTCKNKYNFDISCLQLREESLTFEIWFGQLNHLLLHLKLQVFTFLSIYTSATVRFKTRNNKEKEKNVSSQKNGDRKILWTLKGQTIRMRIDFIIWFVTEEGFEKIIAFITE